uniref:Laminin subunit alpha 5 n=1 Tax=Anser brachyrhynchus TaxID=132585 RepID=A0A8B9BKZ0_9AVES
QGQYCDICSSANSNKAHPITNAIDGTERWWQSPPLSRGLEFNQVNVTLDLGQLFHVAYVLIKFANSPRPDLWVLERSTDFGLTYEPWQYFASSKRDCIEKFGLHTVDRITKDDHAICTTEYSRIVPLENGEIVVSLVNGRPGAMNFSYSPLLRNFTKATNIRLRFLQTNTLLGHLMGKALRDPTVTRRYYYSIKDISIGGRCVCHGHADVCDAKDPNDPYRYCDCQHNTCGGSCDRCCPGFNQFPWKPATADSANECQPCNCNGHAYDCYYDPEVDRHKASKSREDRYEGGGVCIDCQHHTTGINCERCIPGYYRSPDHPIDSPYICYRCNCESDFTDGTCEDLTGRCYCKPNYTGEHCDACAEGYLDFPHCYRKYSERGHAVARSGTSEWAQKRSKLCLCAVGTLPGGCDSSGRCFCRPEFAGPRCEQCSAGYHSYPHCYACQCSREGSLHSTCDQETGQCSCRPKVTGLRCDSCVPGAYGFPHCEGSPLLLLGTGTLVWDGSCACRAYVEGPACDRCKPLYWNLTPENPYGCTSCKCDTRGTISGIAECQQGDGQCFCKPNTCGQFCSTCKDGYFSMENANYFGCQGCRCDVGGSLGPSCEERSGACRCRQSTRGPTCTQPARDHYFPDLHHLKFELEEGTTPAGRAVRFGYNPLEFEGFSWRGYAQMSSIQNKIRVTVDVKEAELYLFHVILRYINSGGATVYGKITAYQPRRRGTEQTKQIVFAPSTEPAFVTVPQNSFGEPFVLNPNTWSLVVEAEGVLLDYLVLLPSSYYEAPILQLKVTEPCTYQPAPEQEAGLQHRHPACTRYGEWDRKPPFSCLSVLQVEVQLSLPIAQPGKYVLVVEYANTNALQTVGVAVSSPHLAMQQGTFTFYPCVYRYVQASDLILFIYFFSLCSRVWGQDAVVFNSRIQNLGRYAFILHYYQPNHPTFPVEVLINGGRIWQGQTNATFCPHGYGCRSLVVSEDQIILDVTDNDLTVVVQVPEGKQLWLDYILVVPEDSYSSQYLQEEPLDKSYDFISSCGINSFYINPSTSSRFCRDSAISLSLFYNNGAQPCQCHEAGARGSQCEPFGGQCPCKSNVIGRECSRCATGYWGFPNCRPCDCGTRLCDEVTGQCICPPHTLKPECVVCEPQTFGCHPLIGCEDCNCSRPGVQELTEPGCDVDSGQCRCKPNVIGRQCDLCAPGYYHYPNCQRCDCHPAGTEASTCDPVTGQCHCKENVEGPRCDQCRLGTFSLDASNPKGCTKCFCFGATDRCRSAEKYRAEFVDMNGWLLLSSDRQEVPASLSLREQLLRADLKNLPDAYQELYWVAPSSYLGDRVSSYGGHLRYELHSDPRRGDVFIPMESRPDVILKGNQMSIMFLEGSYPSPGGVHEGQLQLVEGNFRHTETHNPVSREELMMVLANLEQLQIRALFSQLSSSVSLRRVVLEIATDTATGVQASNVELCFCPANYQGDSCQECAPGYYRDTKGLFLGKCIPCHCNGHSDQCLPGSGICLVSACTFPFTPCRFSFAVGCVRKGSNMQCLCKPGYAGPNCERCAPGYYGNPLVIGSSCQPCDCSRNTDPNMLFSSCDSLTGACTGCMHHTAGARCEVCAPGFYGDAVTAKNCTREWGRQHALWEEVLHRVKSEFHSHWESNQDLVSSIQDRLAQHSSQLMDLRDALNEAVNKTRQTEDLNSLNRNNLEESQVDLHHIYSFCPAAYEKLAALLDGAKLPLTERVKKFSPASSKIPIVEQAEEHARLLSELAKNLSRLWAEVADHNVLWAGLRPNMLSMCLYVSLIAAIKGTLQTAKDKLANLRTKKEQLLNQLQSVQDMLGRDQGLSWVGTGALCLFSQVQAVSQDCFLSSPGHLRDFPPVFPEDTKEAIQKAKAAATEANETASRVEDTLSTMRKNLDEWKDKYGGLRNEDLNRAVQDARKSGECSSCLAAGAESSRQWFQPFGLGFLSLQVKVPMKFNGSSGVQVRMPSNLQDLAAYTSLKFYIQNPEPRSRQRRQDGAEEGRFVLYLGSREATGDYLGIVLKDHKVQWVYKLGNEEPASLTVDEEIGEQFATINSVAKGEQGLLNLDPHNVVFYVGGYPSSFTPPPTLRYPNYRGCLELDTLNEEVVSLYNFQHTFQLDTTAEKPCARSKSTGDPWLTDGSYFDGTGYAEIKFESQFGTTKRFEQEIRVVSYNGILFFLENQAGARSSREPPRLREWAGAIGKRGLWKWQSHQADRARTWMPCFSSQQPAMLGLALTSLPWHPLQVARSVSVHGHGYLTLALKDVPGLRDFYSGFSFQTSQHEGLLYHHATQVGSCCPPSYPGSGAETLTPAPGAAVLLLGKGRDFGGVRDPSQRTAAITGRGSASCPTQLGAPSALGAPRAAAGSLRRSRPPSARGEARSVPTPRTLSPKNRRSESGGSLQLWAGRVLPSPPCPCRSHFSLEVRLNSSNGLLFYVAGKRGTFMALFVSNGRFIFVVDVGRRRLRIRSKDKYRDRRWHTVSSGMVFGKTSLKLVALPPPLLPQPSGLFVARSPLYVGGIPAGKAKAHVPVRARFDGCLRNPQLDGKPLGAPSRTFGVTPCYEGALESGVFFAADGGSISLGTPQQPGLVSLEVRPRSASGLIFHVGTRRSHHLLLYMEETKVAGRAASPWVFRAETDQASTAPSLPPLPHYVGCVRNLLINQSHVNLLQTGTVRGSVGLRGCPVL